MGRIIYSEGDIEIEFLFSKSGKCNIRDFNGEEDFYLYSRHSDLKYEHVKFSHFEYIDYGDYVHDSFYVPLQLYHIGSTDEPEMSDMLTSLSKESHLKYTKSLVFGEKVQLHTLRTYKEVDIKLYKFNILHGGYSTRYSVRYTFDIDGNLTKLEVCPSIGEASKYIDITNNLKEYGLIG